MSRVSHSILDPVILPLVPRLYNALHIPRRLPPEAIVLTGHALAAAGAVGLAFSTTAWWGGLLAAAGVALNHLCDMVDGTHARRTGQCRNGGELLDHLLDPISFSYWMIGLALSIHNPLLAAVMVLAITATAILTNIKAKLIGRFELARFGPTEFKTLLAGWGLAASGLVIWGAGGVYGGSATGDAVNLRSIITEMGPTLFVYTLAVVLVIQFLINLVKAVRDVNRDGGKADTSEWEVSGNKESKP